MFFDFHFKLILEHFNGQRNIYLNNKCVSNQYIIITVSRSYTPPTTFLIASLTVPGWRTLLYISISASLFFLSWIKEPGYLSRKNFFTKTPRRGVDRSRKTKQTIPPGKEEGVVTRTLHEPNRNRTDRLLPRNRLNQSNVPVSRHQLNLSATKLIRNLLNKTLFKFRRNRYTWKRRKTY